MLVPIVLLTQCLELLEVLSLKPIGLVKSSNSILLILHHIGLRQSGLNLFSALNLDFMANLAIYAFEQSSVSLNTTNPFRGFQWDVKTGILRLSMYFYKIPRLCNPRSQMICAGCPAFKQVFDEHWPGWKVVPTQTMFKTWNFVLSMSITSSKSMPRV